MVGRDQAGPEVCQLISCIFFLYCNQVPNPAIIVSVVQNFHLLFSMLLSTITPGTSLSHSLISLLNDQGLVPVMIHRKKVFQTLNILFKMSFLFLRLSPSTYLTASNTANTYRIKHLHTFPNTYTYVGTRHRAGPLQNGA